jgi:ribonuclease G
LSAPAAGDGETSSAAPSWGQALAASRYAVAEEILVNVTPQETRVAVIEHGVTHELHIERTSSRGMVGNICMGRVVRVLPGMQSAFVDIGGARAAFLHVADIWGSRSNGSGAAGTPIERLLSEGQSLVVQVIKDPIGTKGARLSTQISIAGRCLVYLPQESHIGISQRIEDEEERAHLREKLQQLLPPQEKGGFIIRTLAETATEDELRSDIEYLLKLWQGIQERAQTAATLTLLYQDLNLSLRVLRDFVHDDTARILIDSRESFQSMQQFAVEFTPSAARRLEHYQGERPLFDLYGVEDEIEKALARRVELKSGGYLILDQTEALTTVDVNTGAFVGGRNFDDTIFKTNLEAAQVIARQLRLRNLGGIIIIDFIDMETEEHRNAVLGEFRKALRRDRTRMTVNGFTQLGLVEMTRKRTRESLAHVLCEPCPVCDRRGELKTARTVCYQVLRELLREARQFSAREFRILASQQVIDMFLDEESQTLAMLSDFICKPVSLQVESAYNQEQFDIILM